MDPSKAADELGELSQMISRPKEWTAKKTMVAYGTAILTPVAICAHLYKEPSLVKPCEGQVGIIDTAAIVTSTSSVAASPNLLIYSVATVSS